MGVRLIKQIRKGQTMKLFKKSERFMDAAGTRKALRETGYTVKEIGEFCKWKEIEKGRMQVSLTIWEAKGNGSTFYMVEDTIGRVAAQFNPDKADVMNWLKDHGYKPVKQWYIEDTGMTEETWNIWNGKEETEE